MQTLPSLLSIIGNESVRKIRSAADVTDSSYRQCSGTETRYRPRGGGGETICPPRRWQFDPKIAADLHPSADGSTVHTSLVAGGG